MKRFLLLAICSCLGYVAQAQVVSLSDAEVSKLKKLIKLDPTVAQQWEDLLTTANQSLTATPNPADTILTEGILQGNPRKTKTWKSLEDMQKIYTLSLAFKITGEQKYLGKATDFLSAWAKGNTPMGNPINDTNLDRIIFSYDLLKSDLSKDINASVTSWLAEVASQEIKSYDKASKGAGKTHYNNWNSHRIKVVTSIAYAINNEELKSWARSAYQQQILRNLLPDGSSFDFHERDALHYHIYDVDPLLVTAITLSRDQTASAHPYTYRPATGSSLKKSIAWLIPFFTGEKTHQEWVNSKSAFDKKRADNGEKGYIAGTLFKPDEARTSIALASFFEPELLIIYQQQTKSTSKYPTWQFVLNAVKR